MLDWLFSLDALAAFLTCFATLMIFSFLYRDNPFYKFAEHVFVGTSTGYGITLVWFQILRPNLVERLLPPADAVKQQLLRAGAVSPEAYLDYQVTLGERLAHGQFVYYVFLVLGILMLFKISRKLHWLSRWPLAYVIGAFAGIQIIQATQGALVPQLEATMKDFSGRETAVATLEGAGVLPAAEMAVRREAQAGWIADWVASLGVDATRAAAAGAAWQRELETRLNGLAGLADPEARDARLLEAFKTMRRRQAEVVARDNDFDELLCRTLGGVPMRVAQFALAGQASEPGDPRFSGRLETMDAGSKGLDLRIPAPWQERLILAATRVWLESPTGRADLADACGAFLGLPGAVNAEALAYPEGRPSLVQLLKAEGFTGAAPDWTLPVTRRMADSLLSEVNPRPARFAEWQPAQVADLLERLGPGATLEGELGARLAVFAHLPDSTRRPARTAFLTFWSRGIERELRELRRTWLLHTIALHTAPELGTPYTRGQVQAFRADPAAFLAPHGAAVTNGSVRLGMLVEVLSNLLVLVGVCAGIFYFFFSKKHTGALGVVSKVGVAFLMMSFGASFGYTVMGRISLAIGRFQDLLAWPWMAGTALIVLVVALALESRRLKA